MPTDAPARGGSGYELFFGFREPPFSLAPNTRFLFDSASHAAAREQVGYALKRREPLVVVTGDIGTGKTLLCRSVVERLERRTFLSIVHDPQLERDELLKQMLQDFGVISKDRTRLAPTTRHDLVHALQEFLLSLVPLQAHAVLVVDEAQYLQPEVMEQVRIVSNIHDEAGALLQVVLVGQPGLEQLLSRPELRQLKQRVTRHVRLGPLGVTEVARYIDHRLAVARGGAEAAPGEVTFAPEAVTAIWEISGGIPRTINLLCDRALEAAWRQQARTIGPALVDAAARELNLGFWVPVPAVTRAAFPSESVDGEAPPEPRLDEVAIEPLPSDEAPAAQAPADASRTTSRIAVAAALVIVVAAAAWYALRTPSAPAARESSPSSAAQQPPVDPGTAPPSAPVPATPAAVDPPGTSAAPVASVPPAPPPANPPAASSSAPAVPTAGAAASTPYEVIVASFRTNARATIAADELTALGHPVRRRESDGWQQVLAGPFASRAAAEEVQQSLERAGYTGTKVVPAPR